MTIVVSAGTLGAVNALAERIRWILKHRNIGQRDLGKSAGLSESYVSVFLQRVKSDPKASMRTEELVALARAARVSVRWLSTGDGSPDDLDEARPRRATSTDNLRDRSDWASNLAGAKAARPQYKGDLAWVWETLAISNELRTIDHNAASLAETADLVARYGKPPPGWKAQAAVDEAEKHGKKKGQKR